MKVHENLFVGGEMIRPTTSDVLEVINPHTEEVCGRVPHARPADIDAAVAAARRSHEDGPWARMAPAERADVFAALSAAIQGRAPEIAAVISEEMGCPISFSNLGQVLAVNMVLDYYTGLVRDYPFAEKRPGMMGTSLVRKLPCGVVAAVVPWNVPMFAAMLKLAPALAAGCSVVLKTAPETPLDSYLLAEACTEAGIPPGVVNIVSADRESSEHLVTHEGVDKVAFTGSTAAGRKIAAMCGERLKRCTLELGGKSAAILLEDVDLDSAVPGLIQASLMNSGQACVGQTRILAPRGRYAEVTEALAEAFGRVVVGDPMDPMTECGPLVAARQRDRVEGHIAAGRDEGAKVVVGGGRPEGLDRGWYVQPTLFTDVDNSMRIAQEEIFGPVVVVIPHDGEDDAVRIANDSPYGLSGSVWSADQERALEIAGRVQTGTSNVNLFTLEFGAPFGGWKSSGLGRELGQEGMEAYLELQSITLPHGHPQG